MSATTYALEQRKITHRIFTPIRDFLADSRAGGIILICCTILSLVLANLPSTQTSYTAFWQKSLPLSFGFINLPGTYLLGVNDILMTIFFFLVGMEIKRELMAGELASVKKSMLPVLGALGGMLVPAAIFTLFNGTTGYRHGWGIPMATDIAFSLGVVSLLGKRVPVQLKIFLCALAIIDDLGAVITIGIFYTSALNLVYLISGLGILGAVILMNRSKVTNPIYYSVPAILLWYCMYNSGVHATLAGVMMAFAMPLKSMARVEHLIYKPVNFLIMPLFALANTAIALPSDFGHAYASTVSLGIMAGLVVGKPIGIFLFAFIATKLKIASMPSHTSYKQLLGMGILGGIGFTMSIFTSTLAYPQEALQVISKVSIISASVIAAISGYFYCTKLKPVSKAITTSHTEKAVTKQQKEVEEEQPLAMPDLVFG